MAVCPQCKQEGAIETVRRRETIAVRGEPIEVTSEYRRCGRCGAEWENTRGGDALAEAYRGYRSRHGLLQPEEIARRRKAYGLTQRELSELLGWGGATLSRYENGALQAASHEKMLRLAMEPRNLLLLIEESPGALPAEKQGRLARELAAARDLSFEQIFEERFGAYPPDEFSGYRRLDLKKLYSAILFFCEGGQLKTKLNKLLFYADFKHFKEHTVSLTGAHYVHLTYGPVPDNFNFYFAELAQEGRLAVEEVVSGQYVGENLVSRSAPDLSEFSAEERATLQAVKAHFRRFNSSEIAAYSHAERAYAETGDNEPISYRYAGSLRL